jgi:hypothetical protein
LLVHRVGFESRADGKLSYHHSIDEGEFDRGFFLADRHDVNFRMRCQSIAYWVSTPLRWLEIVSWHFVPRTYEWRNGPPAHRKEHSGVYCYNRKR